MILTAPWLTGYESCLIVWWLQVRILDGAQNLITFIYSMSYKTDRYSVLDKLLTQKEGRKEQ